MSSSAGIYPEEIDASLYASIDSVTVFGMVGLFSKGELDLTTPELITSYPELLKVHGKPVDGTVSQAWYAARSFLRRGNQLKSIRVESAATPAVASTGSIRGYDTDAVYAGSAIGACVAPNVFNDATPATFITNNVEPGDILFISAGAGGNIGYYEIDTVPLETQLTVKAMTTWAGAVGAQTYSILTGKRNEQTDGVTSTPAVRTLTSALGSFAALAPNNLNCNVQVGDLVVIDETDLGGGEDEDNGVYVISAVTSSTVLTVNRDWPVGSKATLNYAIYSHSAGQEIGVTSVPGTRTLTCAGHDFTGHGVLAGDILVVNDAGTPADNGTFVITNVAATVLTINQDWPDADGGGAGNVALTFRVFPASVRFTADSEGTGFDGLEAFVTKYEGIPGDDYDKVNVEIREDGVQVEKWFGTSYTTIVTDLADSEYVTPVLRAGANNIAADQDCDFGGGDDGATGVLAGDYIGSAGKGLQAFASPESTEIDLLATPGVVLQAVGDAMVVIAEERRDCLALLDTPPWATIDTAQEAVAWHNGSDATLGRAAAVSSSFAVVNWPWVKQYDSINSAYVWTAPSGHHASAIAYNDRVAYPWWAPAGAKRGILINAADVRTTPTQGQRDFMQAGTNCVNPIVNFSGEGIMMYGQKTCLRTNSALNRINVRRGVSYITKKSAEALRSIVFDPNDSDTWAMCFDVIDPLTRYVKRHRGLNDYLIVCDATNNTSTTIDNHQLIIDVYVKPTKAAEIIKLRFTVTAQGVDFAELLAA